MSNCYCCLWPYECGCEEVDREVQTPNGYPEPPKNITCPRCNRRVDAIYEQTDTYCACCFIPCPCCKCGDEPPHCACPNCNYKFSPGIYSTCSNCHATISSAEKHCSECGRRNENSK